jgi:hypothetical protein
MRYQPLVFFVIAAIAVTGWLIVETRSRFNAATGAWAQEGASLPASYAREHVQEASGVNS